MEEAVVANPAALKKKRRRRNKALCTNDPLAEQRAGYKDTKSSYVAVDGILFSESTRRRWYPSDHILARVKPDLKGAWDVGRAILKEDVGVDLRTLHPEKVGKLDLRPWFDTLLEFLKRIRRLSIYVNIGMMKCQDASPSTYAFNSSPKEVLELLHFVVRHVVPVKLFGSQRNWTHFMSAVKRIVFGCRHQNISLSSIMWSFRVSEVPWLVNDIPSNCVRLHLLSCTVKWLLGWIQLIIRHLWHVTETIPKVGLMFYKRTSWLRLRSKFFKEACHKRKLGLISPVEQAEIMAWSQLRLIPKTSRGLRPISMLKIPKESISGDQIAFAKSLTSQMVHLYGGINTPFSGPVGEVLQLQLLRILNVYPDPISRPKYYFVRVDIKDAFGSINLSKIASIFEKAAQHCVPDDLRVEVVKFSREVGPWKRKVNFKYFQTEKLIVQKRPHWINCGNKEIVSLSPAIKAVKRLIQSIGVKEGNNIYRVTHGLPQGMVLSGILCELYYAFLDNQHLRDFQGPKHGEIFLRYCDDYLFLTPDGKRAENFLKTMELGFSDFSCQINTDKTLTNVHQQHVQHVTYVGFSINLETFCVEANFDNFKGVNVCHTMSFANSKNPGRLLEGRMKLLLKLSPILLDRRINNKHVALFNVYQVALFMAFRFNAYIKVNFSNKRMNSKFLIKCMLLGVKYLRKKIRSFLSKQKTGKWISEHEVSWLAFKAFKVRLGASGAIHGNIISWLKWKLQQIHKKLTPVQARVLSTVCTHSLPGSFATMK